MQIQRINKEVFFLFILILFYYIYKKNKISKYSENNAIKYSIKPQI